MTPGVTILDTFPRFLTWWERARANSPDEWADSWAMDYLAPWPELLALQVADYEAQGLDWRRIAQERIFPALDERLAAMRRARRHLLRLCGPTYERARAALGFEEATLFVIHVGIGCGAGWATRYADRRAVLFGLENIAECGWSDPDTIAGLIAHEIGHLAHQHWREQHGKPPETGPWWQLYEEGFAQVCESLTLGGPHWHQTGGDEGWLDWCQANVAWLAAEFIAAADSGRSVHAFFGSWYDLQGRSQTGYFLGHAAVAALLTHFDLKELARLENVAAHLRPVVERLAAK